jgi:uncharacterized protein (DUF2164 family)
MPISLPREQRTQAVASIERYFAQELDQRIGNIAAGALLGFFMQEIAPLVYNQAIADAQASLRERVTELDARVSELDIELHEEPFGHWKAQGAGGAMRGGQLG